MLLIRSAFLIFYDFFVSGLMMDENGSGVYALASLQGKLPKIN
jgi:hypothetical protein